MKSQLKSNILQTLQKPHISQSPSPSNLLLLNTTTTNISKIFPPHTTTTTSNNILNYFFYHNVINNGIVNVYDIKIKGIIDDIISYQNINKFIVLMYIDLNEQSRVLYELIQLLKKMENVNMNIMKVFEMLGKRNNVYYNKQLINAMKMRFGNKHRDVNKIRVLGFPVIIVADNYEKFVNNASQLQLQMMSKSLRFVAHLYGASLIYTSLDTGLNVKRLKKYINYFINSKDCSSVNDEKEVDVNKPINVFMGKDDFLEISKSQPIAIKKRYTSINSFEELKSDKILYTKYEQFVNIFGKFEENDKKILNEEENFKYYKEERIDLLKKQKDEELIKYQSEIEKEERQLERENKMKRRKMIKEKMNI